MATALRFLQIFSLGAWVGSIVFFIVFTAGIFPVVNNNDLTGALVGYALGRLHVMGIVAGVVYLLATVAAEKSFGALVQPAALLVFLMIVCTMASQYGVIARMDALKLQMGSVDATPPVIPCAWRSIACTSIRSGSKARFCFRASPRWCLPLAGNNPLLKVPHSMLKPSWRDARISDPKERENKNGNFRLLDQSGFGNCELRSVEAPVLSSLVRRRIDHGRP